MGLLKEIGPRCARERGVLGSCWRHGEAVVSGAAFGDARIKVGPVSLVLACEILPNACCGPVIHEVFLVLRRR